MIDSVNIFSALTGISSLSAQSNRFAQSVTQNRQKARTVEAEAENATEYNSRIIEAQEESFRPGRQSVTAVQEASQSTSTAVEKSNKEMMEAEMDDHLGYHKSERSESDDYRNGYKSKRVNSSFGSLDIQVPQDRNSTFEPQVVKKRQKDIFLIPTSHRK